MGIKFRCPNGHKMNVKGFLAGKRGICPDCGLSFRIPDEATAATAAASGELLRVEPLPSKEGESTGEAAGEDLLNPHPIPSFDLGGILGPTKATPVSEMPVIVVTPAKSEPPTPTPATASAPAAKSMPTAPAAVAPAAPIAVAAVPVVALPVAPAAVDPIAQAPLAQWYVRPPAGGQFGPARGDVMRKWIDEGRVSADSLAWREGMPEWLNAGELFPSLLKGGAAGTNVASVATTISLVPAAGNAPRGGVPVAAASPAAASVATTTAVRSANRYVTRKQSKATFGIAALVGLALLSIILVVVLAVVLSRTYNGGSSKSKTTPAAAAVPKAE